MATGPTTYCLSEEPSRCMPPWSLAVMDVMGAHFQASLVTTDLPQCVKSPMTAAMPSESRAWMAYVVGVSHESTNVHASVCRLQQ